MYIEDITKFFTFDELNNYHCFNNSLLHLQDNLFIVVYRVIRYDSKNKMHPWGIWFHNFKIYQALQKELSKDNFREQKRRFGNTLKLYGGEKYRKYLTGVKKIKIPDDNLDLVQKDIMDHDSTGLALLEYQNGAWKMIFNINNLFLHEMNQDTRICRLGGKIYLSYNAFIRKKKELFVRMVSREISLNLEKREIFLGPEILMLQEYPNLRVVEKNCVHHDEDKILYNIDGEFIVFDENRKIEYRRDIELFKGLKNFYGHENIIFSLGTPPIQYGELFLALGHVKFAYKEKYSKSPLSEFISQPPYTLLHNHGKYIYMFFFFEYNSNFEITRLSDSFIPTCLNHESHLPYLLAFPMSISEYNSKFLIGYGEGDIKTKILSLNRREVEKLLRPVHTLNVSNYQFRLLDDSDLNSRKKILHLGYFQAFNCGDDAFIDVFKYLNAQYYPQYSITFKKNTNGIDLSKFDKTIIGGGDIIGPYFLGPLKKEDKISGVGVGIQYLDQIHLLDKLSSIILRYSGDYERVKELYPEKNVATFPDLVFLFERIYGLGKKVISSPSLKIGFCLPRTYYHPEYPQLYQDFVSQIVDVIKRLRNLNYDVYLIPFGINKKNTKECDIILNSDILQSFPNDPQVIDVSTLPFYKEENYVEITYNCVASMDFLVCGRFHAHIFSTVLRKPFLSLSCSRKCINYMKENNLNDNLYQMETNQILLPINLDSERLFQMITDKLSQRREMKKRLNKMMVKINRKMDSFIDYFLKTIIFD